MKHFFPLLLFFFVGCTGRAPTATNITEISNIIDLSVGLKNVQTVRLSEIADSVSFLPLETTRRSLLRSNTNGYRFSSSHIFWYNAYFDWTGKYGGSIGIRGNGPLEEPQGVFDVFFTDNHFYSKGSKLVEYDATGKPTRKVRNLYSTSELFAGKNPGIFVNGHFLLTERAHFAIYDYPSSLYFIDKNFETVSSRTIAQVDVFQVLPGKIGNSEYATNYKGHVLFYNFMNDTIFYVRDTVLEPRWIVHFDDPMRLPLQTIANLNNQDFHGEAIVYTRTGHYEDSKMAQLAENKHMVTTVYETDSHLFFLMTEIIYLAERRNLPPPQPYIVCYEKSTGETFRVKGKGFVDDLLGLDDYYYPQLGIFDGRLISAIWPYELLESINSSKAKGREVNPQLLELSKQVKEDDNPILIFVHLKSTIQ